MCSIFVNIFVDESNCVRDKKWQEIQQKYRKKCFAVSALELLLHVGAGLQFSAHV